MESFYAITRADVPPHAASVLWAARQGNSSSCLRVPLSHQASAFLLGHWQRRRDSLSLAQGKIPFQTVVIVFSVPIRLRFSTMPMESYLWHFKELAWPLLWISKNLLITPFVSEGFHCHFAFFGALLQQWSFISALPVTFSYGLIQIWFTNQCTSTTCSYTRYLHLPVCVTSSASSFKRRFFSFLLTDTNPVGILLLFKAYFFFPFFLQSWRSPQWKNAFGSCRAMLA